MANVGRIVKESIVKELSGLVAERGNVFVTAVNRLTATEANTLRQKLHATQARFIVVQRKLGRRSLESLGLPGLTDLLQGSVGLVLSGEDVLPTAKTMMEFIKSHGEQLAVRGAVIDGQILDKSRVEQLASLPPKPVLLGQVVSMIEAPIAHLILTVEQLIGDLAWAVEQASTKKPKSDGEEPSSPSEPAPLPAPIETPPIARTESEKKELPPSDAS